MNAYNDWLAHFGIEGMKWGIRRYQNKDGSLTPSGKQRYRRKQLHKEQKENYREFKSALNKAKKEGKHPFFGVDGFSDLPHRVTKDRRVKDEIERYNQALDKVREVKPEGRAYYKYAAYAQNARGLRDEAVKRVVRDYLGKYADKIVDEIDRSDTRYGSDVTYKSKVRAKDRLESQVKQLLYRMDAEYAEKKRG